MKDQKAMPQSSASSYLDDMYRDLENMRAIANRDPSDLRHSNPGKLRRDIRQQHEASQRAEKLQRAITLAEDLDRQDVVWTRHGDWIHFVINSGNTTYPVAGEFADASEMVDKQIEAIKNNFPADQREALILSTLDIHAPRTFKWIHERMAGVSAPKFRKVFLVESGLLEDKGETLEMTGLARDADLLIEAEGEFGNWFKATGLGTAWIYKSYLERKVPMIKKAKYGPIGYFELDAILRGHEKALAMLPSELGGQAA